MWQMLAVRAASLFPKVEQLAVSAAPTLATASARIRAMGVTLGSKADDLIAWAKANPANASVLALTLGSLGVSVADVFESDEGKKVATQVTTGELSLADSKRILEAGASSEKLNLQVAEVAVDLQTAREVLRWAKQHYGSASAAIDAHKMQQAYFEMPLDDVGMGFNLLRL